MPLFLILILSGFTSAYTPKELADRKATIAHITERFGYVDRQMPPCEGLSLMLEEFQRIPAPDSCKGAKKIYRIFEEQQKQDIEVCIRLGQLMKREVQGTGGCASEAHAEVIYQKARNGIKDLKVELTKRFENNMAAIEKDADAVAMLENVSDGTLEEPLIRNSDSKIEYLRMECQIPYLVFLQSRKKLLSLHMRHFGSAESTLDGRCTDPSAAKDYFDFLERGDGGR